MFLKAKKTAFAFLASVLVGCAGADVDAPVNSSELIDSDVEYAEAGSEIEVTPEAPREFQREAEADSGAIISNPDIPAIPEEVTVAPAAKEDEMVDFTVESYVAESYAADSDFDTAVRQAQISRGIDPERSASKPVPPKAEFKGRLNVSEEPKEETRQKRENSISFLSAVVYHSRNQADMSAKDVAAIREVARFAKANNATARIVGHASSRTRDMRESENKIVNFDLSIKRASNVRGALLKSGMKPSDVLISGVSDTENVAYENMPINEAVNRRTEIYIEY
ncbi:MAG: OmpA family protein [Rickettsiales bacterium]|jgi:outer membrane protein OmpA-like peptidoglycan-associated protein|nr:OmpA family protein [Rickettsiales bacterium]